MGDDEQMKIKPTSVEVEMWVVYLMAERDSLCRKLAMIEKTLADLGHPVSKPKIAKT